MEISKTTEFIDDLLYDDYHAEKCKEWYCNDACILLTPNELSELHTALNEWIASNNIVRVQTVGKVNYAIKQFLESQGDEDV